MVKCKVCGNRSTGVHYGVVSCEGCKAFYKRGLGKAVTYKCYFGKRCYDDDKGIHSCRACRFQKCIELGMDIKAPKRGRRSKLPTNGSGSAIKVSVRENPKTMSDPGKISRENSREDSPVSLGSLITFGQRSVIENEYPENIHRDTPNNRENIQKAHPMPDFLNNYWRIMHQKDVLMKNTIHRVEEAMHQCYGDVLTLWGIFQAEVNARGIIPPRQNIPLETMVAHIQDDFSTFFRRGRQFLFLLPGFSDLDESDKFILLAEKFTDTWLFCHAPYIQSGEWHILVGPNRDVHCSRYWMRQILDEKQYDTILTFASDLNDLRLTHLEQFLLLAVAVFHPDFTMGKNKSYLSAIYTHYMDCLLHSISSRCTLVEYGVTEKKLQEFMFLFRTMYKVDTFKTSRLDSPEEKPSVQPVRQSSVIKKISSAAEATDYYNDDLVTFGRKSEPRSR